MVGDCPGQHLDTGVLAWSPDLTQQIRGQLP